MRDAASSFLIVIIDFVFFMTSCVCAKAFMILLFVPSVCFTYLPAGFTPSPQSVVVKPAQELDTESSVFCPT